CAVAGVVGSTERANPLDRFRSRIHGAVYNVKGPMIANRGVYRVLGGNAVLFMNPRKEIVDRDAGGRRKKEVFLDPIVPLKLFEWQVAVPKADARKASRVVQSRTLQRERTVHHGTRGDVDPLHKNTADRPI